MATFAKDIGYSDKGVVPDAGNLAHAITSEGAAKGAANASLIKYFGNQAIDAYEGKLVGDVVKARNDALSKLDTGDFIGPTARETLQTTGRQLTEVKDEAVVTVFDRSMQQTTDPTVRSFESRIHNIQAAGEQGVISQDEARQRITVALKKAIAAMPGRADSFRKAAGADWDRLEWMDALTKQTAYEREAAAGAKAAEKAFDDTVDFMVKFSGEAPDAVRQRLMSDPSYFDNTRATAILMTQASNDADLAKDGQTQQNITSEQYSDAVAKEYESRVTVDVVGAPLLMNTLMEEAGIDLNLLSTNGSYDYNKEEQYGVQLAGVRSRMRSHYEGRKNAALLDLDRNADPRMMNANKVKLREEIEKRYNELMVTAEKNPHYVMEMFDAVKSGNRNKMEALSSATNLTNNILRLAGGDTVMTAYYANKELFARNHPILHGFIKDALVNAQTLNDQNVGRTGATAVVVSQGDGDKGGEFTSPTNLASREFMAMEGVPLFHQIAIGTDTIEPEHVAVLAETLTFSLGVNNKLASDVASLISSGVMKTTLDKMSEDQRQTLLTTMNNTWQNITLNTAKHFGPVTTIRESFTKPVFVAEGNVEAIRDEVTGDRLQLSSTGGEFHIDYRKGAGSTGKRTTSMVTPVQTLRRNIAIKASITSLITGENEAALKNTYTQEAWDSLRGPQQATTPTTTGAPLKLEDYRVNGRIVFNGRRMINEEGNPNDPNNWEPINE